MQFIRSLTRSAVHYLQGSGDSDCTVASSSSAGGGRRGVRGVRLPRQHSLDSQTLLQVQEVTEAARKFIMENAPLSKLRDLLGGFAYATEAMNSRDGCGYTLLQHAITCKRQLVVEWLVAQGAELNSPICGRPLHLAAKLGQGQILQMLLDYNADPFVVSCVCYPDKHVEALTVYSSHGQRWYTTCIGDVFQQDKLMESQFEYPLYYAILSDSDDCVRILINHGAVNIKSSLPLLHLACNLGAVKCMKYFTKTKQTPLNRTDNKNLTPLQHGVRWGKPMVEYLVLNGGSVMVKTQQNETLLHLLFKNLQEGVAIADTVEYLLGCGLKVNINAVDSGGNSALHLMLSNCHKYLLGSRGTCTPLSARDTPEGIVGRERQYVQTLQLFLDAGLNPNIANRVGDTSLHVLCRIQGKNSSTTKGNVSLRLIHALLQQLLLNGANPNLVTNSDSTVLALLLNHGANAVFEQPQESFVLPAEDELHYLIECVRLLSRCKCEFHSCRYMGPSCLLHAVLGHLDVLDRIPKLNEELEDKQRMAVKYTDAIMSVIQILLECGSRANVCRCIQTDLHTVYYKVMSRCDLLPLSKIIECVLLLLHNGTDPNIGGKHIPMSVFRYRSSHSYWPVYPLLHILNLIGNQEMPEHEHDLFVLFHIFYNTMDDSNAKQCIFHYLEYDRNHGSRTQPSTGKNSQFDEYLLSLLSNPSSLRQICSTFIFCSVADRRLNNLEKLGMPKTLISQVGNFQF